jgi:hypothetical protein
MQSLPATPWETGGVIHPCAADERQEIQMKRTTIGLVSIAVVLMVAPQTGLADSIKKFMSGNQLNHLCSGTGLGLQQARIEFPDGQVIEGSVLCETADLTKTGDIPLVPPPREDNPGSGGDNRSSSEAGHEASSAPSHEPSHEPPQSGDGGSSSSSEPSHESSSEPSHEASSSSSHEGGDGPRI